MSNFSCEQCGAICSDTPRGYVTGCCHYPPDVKAMQSELQSLRLELITSHGQNQELLEKLSAALEAESRAWAKVAELEDAK